MIDPKDYDIITVSTSGGKDSQTILGLTTELCAAQNVTHRLLSVYSDMGEIVWKGSLANVKKQAKHFGIPVKVVSKSDQVSKGLFRAPNTQPLYEAGEHYGDLLDQVERRMLQLEARGDHTPPWFSPTNRFCTSDHKNGPISVLHTKLAKLWRRETESTEPCRILDVQGMRAEESSERSKLKVFETKRSSSNLQVDVWLPIHSWLEEEVWEYIADSGAPYHWAYDQGAKRGSSLRERHSTGMPRLSCVYCCFAPRAALTLASTVPSNAHLLDRFIALEKRSGFTFKPDHSMSDVKRDAKRGAVPDKRIQAWDT